MSFADEQSLLLPLPTDPFPAHERLEVSRRRSAKFSRAARSMSAPSVKVLDRRRSERGLPPPVSIPLAPGEHRDLVVTPHPLSSYDGVGKEAGHD